MKHPSGRKTISGAELNNGYFWKDCQS
jgi:hypothetical protein